MKKLSFFCILALVICSVISCAEKDQFEQELQTQKREQFKEKLSHEVTQAEARENLEKFLLGKKLPSTRGGDTNQLPPITSVYTRGKAALATRAGEEVEPYFHIFNFGDNEGFAIMSGDDRVEPLLALTFKGELTPETEIDNLGFEIAYEKMEEYYVEKVSSQSDESLGLDVPSFDTIPTPMIIDSTYYYPMTYGYCPVKWGQGVPYNKYCFVPNTNTLALTGCVPTAVAQLMAIYKYPNSYCYLPDNDSEDFNWEDMTSQTPSSAGIDDIARLMYFLGKPENLEATYGASASSAYTACVPRTLEYFGYENGGNLISYDADVVISELQNGYPVLMSGKRMNEYAEYKGHSWLAHGLMKRTIIFKRYYRPLGWIIIGGPIETYYILCNWGWDGDADGYYLSNSFNPSNGAIYPDPIQPSSATQNKNYQYLMESIINIRK